MSAKLTLSVDPAVVSRAKRYAKQRGLSVSQMETYLDTVSRPLAKRDLPPLTRALYGTLRRADIEDYHRCLETKYR